MTAFPKLGAIWVYLAASPLLGLTITLIAYLFAQAVYARARFNPLANPVLIAVALIVVLLTITHTPYPTYFEGAQFVHFLLGPATVALALPLYRQWSKLRRAAVPLLVGLLAGSLTLAFFVYAFVNIGMVSGVLPVVGVPLPFMSYGGTALTTLGIAIGMIMSVGRQRRLMKS